MTFWNLFTYTDRFLFIWVAVTVAYLGIFAFMSLFARHSDTPKAKKQNRFIILIPSSKSGKRIEATVRSILGQTYPQRLFDVTVIANQEAEITMFHLAQQPVTLLSTHFGNDFWAKSLQLGINNLPQFKIYDIALILDAGNVVEPEFLEQMNDAYDAAGTKAIQAHRLSLNRDTVSARLSAIFEEINNSIFRRGHITLGLSSATSSSGIAFDFNWFKENILTFKSSWKDKELEAYLIRQHIYIDYFDKIYVYDEKFRQAEDFNREHGNWIIIQLRTFLRNVKYLPTAIINRHYDLIDKIIQWMLIPRMILMAIILVMSMVIPFIYMTAALKWWALYTIVLLIFALATPNYLVDEKWDSTFYKVPFVFFSSVLVKFKLGRRILKSAGLKE